MFSEEFFERVRRRIRDLFEEFEREIESLTDMWSPEGVLRPLHSIREYPDRIEIVIDLPYSNLDTLSVEVRGKILRISCRLRKELEFSSWFRGRGVKYREYRTEIELPSEIDPSTLKIEKDFSRGIVRIIARRRR
ncbi:MAG: Hsp20/alpha crystallin family protein [Thermoprotei archaeon]